MNEIVFSTLPVPIRVPISREKLAVLVVRLYSYVIKVGICVVKSFDAPVHVSILSNLT